VPKSGRSAGADLAAGRFADARPFPEAAGTAGEAFAALHFVEMFWADWIKEKSTWSYNLERTAK
jgi:hypothetical protein